mmetsp:Transcript_15514/g.20387  ORF Transcript_15514/g.20387 Transcript_15514/m.20387 type:complete len:198 (-) Transcript_15514:157-750(-)|eukprot:CAMPEP_0184027730 /NCGR_PEP_ID=MMETSP0954-20121128/14373_1 /TAXON_ID=627963 /ORGANISM="Aplanochytrium sp, Strain PBS07" /LENGTH=197 /DNA_ID=CAMNT_0026312347 /DNA_START=2441 /DNA_END=3034 /DNA_ORIENTATION=+
MSRFFNKQRRRVQEEVVDGVEVDEETAADFERQNSSEQQRREWFAVATPHVKIESYNCNERDKFGFCLLFATIVLIIIIEVNEQAILAFPTFICGLTAAYELIWRRVEDGRFKWCCKFAFFCITSGDENDNSDSDDEEERDFEEQVRLHNLDQEIHSNDIEINPTSVNNVTVEATAVDDGVRNDPSSENTVVVTMEP